MGERKKKIRKSSSFSSVSYEDYVSFSVFVEKLYKLIQAVYVMLYILLT